MSTVDHVYFQASYFDMFFLWVVFILGFGAFIGYLSIRYKHLFRWKWHAEDINFVNYKWLSLSVGIVRISDAKFSILIGKVDDSVLLIECLSIVHVQHPFRTSHTF